MSAASNALEVRLLNHTLRYGTAPYTAPSTIYVALFTADSAGDILSDLESGIFTNEVSTGGYARQTVTFAAASAGSISSNSTVTFTASGGAYGTIVAVALMSAATAGECLFYGSITSKTIADGDSLQFASGAITVSLA
jgi:hypothetical protein